MYEHNHTWVAKYKWPETFRFKHLGKLEPFRMYGRTYVRLSARRYTPCDVSFMGKISIHAGPVKLIDSINLPVVAGLNNSYIHGNENE